MKPITRHTTRIAAAGAVALALLAPPAAADRLYLKNGKTLDGIVVEEFPSRIKFNQGGREIFVERARIDRIEKEDKGKNAEMLLKKAEDALTAGNGNEAAGLLEEAAKIESLTEEQKKLLAEMKPRADKLVEMGTPEERRVKAEELVKKAAEHFDRIEMRQALEALFQAFELDPSNAGAHAEMSRLFESPSPDLNVAADYFTKYVNPETLDGEHKIIPLLPKIFEVEAARLQETTDSTEIQTTIRRLQRLGAAFEARPAWAMKASEVQKELIQKGAFGIVTMKVDNALERENYNEALVRLQALGGEKDRPELTNLYTSVYMGLGQFDKARALLDYSKSQAADPAAVDRVLNALNIYTTAMDAKAKEQHKEARQALELLFEQQAELPREISSLVAKAKVGYDVTAMEALESAEDYKAAADVAMKIAAYSRDEASLATAADVFSRCAPQLSYNFKLQWILDDQVIILPPEWAEGVRQEMTDKFAMTFDEASPFVLALKVIQTSFDKAGPRVLESLNSPDPYTIDYITPDTSITAMRLEFVISHPSDPEIHKLGHDATGLPEPVMQKREAGGEDTRHKKGTIVYMDLSAMTDFQRFLAEDLALYYPPELAVMSAQAKLRPKLLDQTK